MCVYIYISEVKSLSRIQLFVTPWTVAYRAPLSMEFSRQEYWSRLPFPSPEDLPDPGLEPRSPALEADALLSEPQGKCIYIYICIHTHTHTHLTASGFSCRTLDLHWVLVPGPAIEPMFPALQGGFLTTGPPRKCCVIDILK